MKHCTVWLRDLDSKKIGTEVCGVFQNVVLKENGEDKLPKGVIRLTNEVIDHIGEKRSLLNNILRRKVN